MAKVPILGKQAADALRHWMRHKHKEMPTDRRYRDAVGQDWVVIRVKNNSGAARKKWGAGIATGLVDPGDYDGLTDIPPTDLLQREFLWDLADGSSLGGLHAVLIQDLEADAIGKAVVRGIVPGKLSDGVTSTSEYTPEYVAPATGGTTEWSDVDGALFGFGLHGHPSFSRVVYVWGETGAPTWGLIDLNVSAQYHTWYSLLRPGGSDLGVDYGSISLPNGTKTSLASFDNGIYDNDSTPLFYTTTAGTGMASSIAFVRHCRGVCRWTMHVEPGAHDGSASGSLYLIPRQEFKMYARLWTDIEGTPAAGTETLIARHHIPSHLAPTNSSLPATDVPILLSGFFYFDTALPAGTYADSQLPVSCEIRGQWVTTGTASTSAQVIDFTTEWQISQVGARAGYGIGIDLDGQPIVPTRPIIIP